MSDGERHAHLLRDTDWNARGHELADGRGLSSSKSCCQKHVIISF